MNNFIRKINRVARANVEYVHFTLASESPPTCERLNVDFHVRIYRPISIYIRT